MTPLPVVRPEEVVRALERAGFVVERVKGSHHALKHRDKPHLHVTVPFHRKDLPPGTLRSIIRQAGLSVEEFVAFLYREPAPQTALQQPIQCQIEAKL